MRCSFLAAKSSTTAVFGELVPVGDDAAMAEAILRTLDRPRDSERLVARARTFSIAAAADAYLEVLTAPSMNASRQVVDMAEQGGSRGARH